MTIWLSVYEREDDLELDPDVTVQLLQRKFPQLLVDPGDRLEDELRRAERGYEDGTPVPRHITDSLRRKSHRFGPARSFSIPRLNGGFIRGTARRYDVTFFTPKDISVDERASLLNFLVSLGVGEPVDGSRG